MSAIETASPKWERPPLKSWHELHDKWTEIVTVRPWRGSQLGDAWLNQPAYPMLSPDGSVMGFALKAIYWFEPRTEIEQADGTVWIVSATHPGDRETRCVGMKKLSK